MHTLTLTTNFECPFLKCHKIYNKIFIHIDGYILNWS